MMLRNIGSLRNVNHCLRSSSLPGTTSSNLIHNQTRLHRFSSNISKTSFTQPENQSKIPDPLHGSYHWVYERALSVASLGLIAGAFVVPGKGFIDFALGIVIPLHSHIGFGSVITDYLPARKFPRIYLFARGLLGAATAGAIYGLYLYNTNDMGITEGVRSLWKANKTHVKED